ncbi:MAG: hypothetical protein CML29_18020 [Rhizobiales bacterium]|nr:hypothetical protein [Hyphomicrobiales bacterium]|tara:strand:- start:891 stop:2234 length:1344 start_codon:yes stop_codon:yes gene_type:complete
MSGERGLDCRYVMGVTLFACLTLGGGTVRGLLVDSLLEAGIILAATYTIIRQRTSSGSALGLAGLVVLSSTGLLQVIPLPAVLFEGLRPGIYLPGLPEFAQYEAVSTISLSTDRTLPALGFALCAFYLFFALSKMPKGDLHGVIPFFLAGVGVNLAVVLLTYAGSGGAGNPGFLGFERGAGLFANDNHLSALLCASIPLIAYLGVCRRRPRFAIMAILLILLSLLAIGSRAGILTGVSVLLVSFLLLVWRTRTGGFVALGMIIVTTIYGYGAFARIEIDDIEAVLDRSDFALTTLRALRENWVLGTGYGSFDLVYPHYERLDDVYPMFVNHAHNDFLEIALEGGLIGMIGLAAYLVAVLLRLRSIGRAPLQLAAVLSVCVVLVHSAVDYPLRTMAMAAAFVFFNALFFSRPESEETTSPETGDRWAEPTAAATIRPVIQQSISEGTS